MGEYGDGVGEGGTRPGARDWATTARDRGLETTWLVDLIIMAAQDLTQWATSEPEVEMPIARNRSRR